MTLVRLLATLRRRIAQSHTTGGLTVVAAQLGVPKQTLQQWVSGQNVPSAETRKAVAAVLKPRA